MSAATGAPAALSRFAFATATRADDAGLRARLASDVMPGAVAITFRREPSYFDGAHLQGDDTHVIACTDRTSGAIVGMSCRSRRSAGIDGTARRIAYLSDLRGDVAYRSGTLLARGFRELAALHRREPVGYSYAVIYEGNEPALRLLCSGRAGLPSFTLIDRLLTPAIPLDFARRPIALDGIALRRATEIDREPIIDLLRREWSGKQLAPADPADALAHGALRTLAISDFFVATRGARVVACLAAWNQARLRQTHVEAYSGPLAHWRRVINALARITPLRPLPDPGGRLPFIYLAAIASDGNDPHLFDALLRHALNALRRGPWHHAIVGLAESDPLSSVLLRLRRIEAAGLVHSVRFPDDPPTLFESLATRHRPLYLEAGCL